VTERRDRAPANKTRERDGTVKEPHTQFAPAKHLRCGRRHLKHEGSCFRAVVAETDQPVDRVHFPNTGVISLVVEMTVGDMIETAMVRRDGAANGHPLSTARSL
jgi:hypothetical protein